VGRWFNLFLGFEHQVAAAVFAEVQILGVQDGGGQTEREAQVATGANPVTHHRHAAPALFNQAQVMREDRGRHRLGQMEEGGAAQGRFRSLLQERRLGRKKFLDECFHAPR
jgi:hypothetical protein